MVNLFRLGLILVFVGFIVALMAMLLPIILLLQSPLRIITTENITKCVNITIKPEIYTLPLIITFLISIIALITITFTLYLTFKWGTRIIEEWKERYKEKGLV